jgi:predicted Fe-Mo cluster-binding NifX family protein
VRERTKAGVFSEVYHVNFTASAAEDLMTVQASPGDSDLRALSRRLRKARVFCDFSVQENHVDLIGTLVKQYKTLVRKNGARVADFMHEHGVDIVITGHAGGGGVQWLKGYGINVKLVADSGYTVQDAIEASG